jgi:hypothetical protein
MKKIIRKYSIGKSRGGSPMGYFVWDEIKGRMIKGRLDKYDAIGLEHKLNGRKFKSLPKDE